jgi:hypothetical protein
MKQRRFAEAQASRAAHTVEGQTSRQASGSKVQPKVQPKVPDVQSKALTPVNPKDNWNLRLGLFKTRTTIDGTVHEFSHDDIFLIDCLCRSANVTWDNGLMYTGCRWTDGFVDLVREIQPYDYVVRMVCYRMTTAVKRWLVDCLRHGLFYPNGQPRSPADYGVLPAKFCQEMGVYLTFVCPLTGELVVCVGSSTATLYTNAYHLKGDLRNGVLNEKPLIGIACRDKKYHQRAHAQPEIRPLFTHPITGLSKLSDSEWDNFVLTTCQSHRLFHMFTSGLTSW